MFTSMTISRVAPGPFSREHSRLTLRVESRSTNMFPPLNIRPYIMEMVTELFMTEGTQHSIWQKVTFTRPPPSRAVMNRVKVRCSGITTKMQRKAIVRVPWNTLLVAKTATQPPRFI